VTIMATLARKRVVSQVVAGVEFEPA